MTQRLPQSAACRSRAGIRSDINADHPRFSWVSRPFTQKVQPMSIIELERNIHDLELDELGHSTVGAHAALQVIDPHTLAIVVYCGHNAQLIEQAIRGQHYQTKEITSAHEIITITI